MALEDSNKSIPPEPREPITWGEDTGVEYGPGTEAAAQNYQKWRQRQEVLKEDEEAFERIRGLRGEKQKEELSAHMVQKLRPVYQDLEMLSQVAVRIAAKAGPEYLTPPRTADLRPPLDPNTFVLDWPKLSQQLEEVRDTLGQEIIHKSTGTRTLILAPDALRALGRGFRGAHESVTNLKTTVQRSFDGLIDLTPEEQETFGQIEEHVTWIQDRLLKQEDYARRLFMARLDYDEGR